MQNKKNILVLFFAFFFVLSGMVGQIVPYFTKPEGRGYNWMQGFVDDYVGYASYIKEGMYGRNTFRIRSIPPPQTSTTAQLLLVWTGKITGLFGLSAPVAYQLLRFVSGMCLFIGMALFITKLSGSRRIGIAGSVLGAFSTAFGWYNGQYHVLTSFGFTDNVALRFASRPHYMVGAVLFLFISYLNLFRPIRFAHLLVFVLGILLGTIHPSFALLICALSGFMLVWKRKVLSPYLTTIFGLVIGLGMSYWSTHQYPYTWILAFEEYVSSERLSWITISGDLIAFGPVFWVGVVGLIFLLIKTKFRDEKQIYMAVWLILQLLFFFWLYRYFRSERVRYIQSLYFIPMGYGAAMLLRKYIVPGTLIFILLLSQPFYHDFLWGYYANTDYNYYSSFIFPTARMMEAYQWLDKNTPKESMVIASYEAANNIILYSHNYVIGNKQGWPAGEGDRMEKAKDQFFQGMWDEPTTKKYLKDFNIKYIYKGYQEADGFLKYPLYTKLYKNTEVTIYLVN